MSGNEAIFPGGSKIEVLPDFEGFKLKGKIHDSDDIQHVVGSLIKQIEEMAGGISLLPVGSESSEKAEDLIQTSGDEGVGCLLGINERGRKYYNPDVMPNTNGVLIGATGMGKTTLMRNMIRQLEGIRIVFDSSGDMDLDDEIYIPFHKESNFGINPLEVGIDPKSGGPRTQGLIISEFLESQFSSFGIRQMDVTRRIISILYELHGITDDPTTWVRSCPLMSDLISFINYLVDLQQGRYFEALKDLRKAQDAYDVVMEQLRRFGWEEDDDSSWIQEYLEKDEDERSDEEVRRYNMRAAYGKDIESTLKKKMRLEAAIHVYQERVKDRIDYSSNRFLGEDKQAYRNYVDGFSDDGERLLGVKSMFDKLEEAGIFGDVLPSFDKPGVYRIDVLYLETAARQLLIETLMRNILRDRQRIGHDNWNDRIFIFHDEAKDMLEKSKGNPFAITSRIAHQGRKYGIGYWCAGQSDKMIPVDLRGAFYTRIIMGSGGDGLTIKGIAKTYNINEDQVRDIEKGQALISMGNEMFLKYNLLGNNGKVT